MERERSERTWRPGERRVRPRARPPAGRGRGPAAAASPRPRAGGGGGRGSTPAARRGRYVAGKPHAAPDGARAGSGRHGGEPGARWRGSAANGPGGRGAGVRRPAHRPRTNDRTAGPGAAGPENLIAEGDALARSLENKPHGQVSARARPSAADPPGRASSVAENRCRAAGRGGVRVGVHFLAGRLSRPCIGGSRGDSRRLPHTRRPP